MRLLTLGVMLICAVLVLNACSSGELVSAYNPQEDAKKLQGSWKVTGTTFNGQRMSVEDIGNTRLTISGDQYTMAHNGGTVPDANAWRSLFQNNAAVFF